MHGLGFGHAGSYARTDVTLMLADWPHVPKGRKHKDVDAWKHPLQ